MKKIFGIILILIAFAFSANVKPFYFENEASDSVTQQETWNSLVKYKLWGTNGIYLSNEGKLSIEETSGYNGTAKGDMNIEYNHHLGGPTLVGGQLSIGAKSSLDSIMLLGGPTRVLSTIKLPQWNEAKLANARFDGPYCIQDSVIGSTSEYDLTKSKFIASIAGGSYIGEEYSNCPAGVPQVDTNMAVPLIDTTSIIWEKGIDISPSTAQIAYIHVPPDSVYVNDYGTYDKYIDNIKVSAVPTFRLYVVMPPTGRLTRIFVRDGFNIDNSAHNPKIQVVYAPADAKFNIETNEWDLTDINDSTKFTYVDNYQGNLLFYTNKKVDWGSTDKPEYQGTFITTDSMYIGNDFSVSGQLIAKYIYIRTPYVGNFKYVPFDPPILNIDPTALASGKFVENDTDTKIPITLDEYPVTNVTFNYCFVVRDTTADTTDFNNKIPVCGVSSDSVTILKGTKTPVKDVILNVKVDTLVEPNETLLLYVYNLGGAVMPNNQLSGYFTLHLTDGVHVNVAPVIDRIDTTRSYQENLVIPPGTGYIGHVHITDEDTTTLLVSLTDTTGLFNIDSLGNIYTNHVFDYETEPIVYPILISVSDGEYTDTCTYFIHIININEPITIKTNIIDPYEGDIGDIVIGTFIGKDADSTTVSYTISDPTFKIDSLGNISVTKTLDYEIKNSYEVTLTAKSADGSVKDTTLVIKVLNVNEPVHVKDTAFSISENKTGEIGKVTAWDEDNDTITYIVTDTTKYSIDNKGVITIKTPFDYEIQKSDSVKVIVTDGILFDTTVVKINIINEEETSNVNIIHTDTRDSIYTTGPVYTNDPNIQITWKGDDKFMTTDTTVHEGKNVIKLCYSDITKDKPACDSIEIYMSTAAPIVTVAKVDEKNSDINGIKIIETQDTSDNNIYVNNKLNEIKVTVKDTVTGETENFVVKAKLDTISIDKKDIKDLGVTFNEKSENIKHSVIEPNKIEISETEIIDGIEVTIFYYVDSTGKALDTLQTVTYTKKINGKDVTISYNVDALTGTIESDYTISYEYKDDDNIVNISYNTDEKGNIKKNKEGSIGYTVSYTYTNKYGNTGTAEVNIVLDTTKPVVKILAPVTDSSYYQNAVEVIWTVNGIEQDTLNLERLENGVNKIIRMYEDKAGNIGADTVYIILKNAKAITVELVNPVTEIDKDKVDEYYFKGNTYDSDKPYNIIVKDPESTDTVETIGIGFKIDIVLPTVSSTGGLATIDDMIQTVNGKTGILVDKSGKLKSGTSTGADGSYVISVDDYIDDHCNEDYKKEFNENGLDKTAIWTAKYTMHVWIFTTNNNYVNDFKFNYQLDNSNYANDAGIVTLYMDMIPDTDGYIKAKNHKKLGTGSYIYKLEAKSKAELRCDLPDKKIGDVITKKENDVKIFGYKRPIK